MVSAIRKAGEENTTPSVPKDKHLLSILQTESSGTVDENGEPLPIIAGYKISADESKAAYPVSSDSRSRRSTRAGENGAALKQKLDGKVERLESESKRISSSSFGGSIEEASNYVNTFFGGSQIPRNPARGFAWGSVFDAQVSVFTCGKNRSMALLAIHYSLFTNSLPPSVPHHESGETPLLPGTFSS